MGLVVLLLVWVLVDLVCCAGFLCLRYVFSILLSWVCSFGVCLLLWVHCGAIGSFGWLSFWCLVNVVFVVVRLWFRLFVVIIVFCLFVLVTGVWLVFDSVVCVICGLRCVIDFACFDCGLD